MKRATLALTFCLMLAAAPLPAQKKAVPLDVQGDTYLVVKTVPFKVVAPAGAADYSWTMPAGVEGTEEDNVLTVTKAPAGQFVIKVKTTVIDFDAKKFKKDAGSVTVTFGGVAPPTPGPTPTPTPTPGDAPITGVGFRVMIIYESEKRKELTKDQDTILTSVPFRSFLSSVCADDQQTGTKKAWWIIDKDADVSGLAKNWQDAMKRPRKGTPWILVSDGVTGFEGPLPADVDATTALIKKYVPAKTKGDK
jgi:hypothetical protein